MELSRNGGLAYRNKLGDPVEIEDDFVFPLLKCSDLANGRSEPNLNVLMTQTQVGEDTSKIARIAPRTWGYLNSRKSVFDARKSSIYASRIPFAIFGVGAYSFKSWKVAVSGLHKKPRFVLVSPFRGKPTQLDDTCYFLPFDCLEEASVVADILNSAPCLRFISSLLFEDSKRPITVDLLQRLNIRAIAEEAGLVDRWTSVRERNPAGRIAVAELQAEFLMDRS